MPSTIHRSYPFPNQSDAPDVPLHLGNLANALDTIAIDSQGVLASRPAAGNTGRYYYATDNGKTYRDNGTSWDELVLTGDSRFTNTRTPTDNSVTTAKIVDANVTTNKFAAGAVTAAKFEAQQSWTAMTFAPATSSNTVAYMKDSLGFVHLRGQVTFTSAPGAGTVLCTLPTGYQPEETYVIGVGTSFEIATVGGPEGSTSRMKPLQCQLFPWDDGVGPGDIVTTYYLSVGVYWFSSIRPFKAH